MGVVWRTSVGMFLEVISRCSSEGISLCSFEKIVGVVWRVLVGVVFQSLVCAVLRGAVDGFGGHQWVWSGGC